MAFRSESPKSLSRGGARNGSTKVEAERAKLNDSDVGLQDGSPKPTGAKKPKPRWSP